MKNGHGILYGSPCPLGLPEISTGAHVTKDVELRNEAVQNPFFEKPLIPHVRPW